MQTITRDYASFQAEYFFLAVLFLQPSLLALYVADVEEEYFSDTILRPLWRESVKYYQETQKYDGMTVLQRVYGQDLSTVETINMDNTPFFHVLMGIEWAKTVMVAGSVGHAQYYQELKRQYATRQMKTLLDEEAKRINAGEDIERVQDEMQEKKQDVQRLLHKKLAKHIVDAHENAFSEMITWANDAEKGIGAAMYGYPTLDETTFGMSKGQFVVLGAQQATGKSMFAMQFALNMARQGKSILFVSLEMPEEQVLRRVWANLRNVSYAKLMQRARDEQLMVSIDGLRSTIENMQIELLCEGGVSVQDIEKRVAKKHYDVVVVDYVQLLRGKGKSRYEEVTGISNGLKSLAMKYDTAVLGLAQLSKEGQKSGRPFAYHLKDSSSLEQDAEVIMLLHKDLDDPECQKGNMIKMYIEKNRNGVSGATFRFYVDFATMRITGCHETF